MAVPTRTRLATRLATLLATCIVVSAGCTDGDDQETEDPIEPSPSSTPSPSESALPERFSVQVYFVGETPMGTRLFQEVRQVQVASPVDEALALLTAADVLDPDYSTLLPAGAPTVVPGDHSKAIGVNLPSSDWTERPPGMSRSEARLAVQQIVYTLQATLRSEAPVEFFYDGLAPIFGIDKPSFRAAPQNAVLALVNVAVPMEGTIVEDVFDAGGVANSFEATVPWEIRNEEGRFVQRGVTNAAGWGDHLYPWVANVDVSSLAPGTYTFVAMTDDPSDGEGAGPTEDTKTITVR